MLGLRYSTPPAWVQVVLDDFDSFLLDHASAERKASAMAMSFVVRYPDRIAIHEAMITVAREELAHFHRVFRLCAERKLRFAGDVKDPYVRAMIQTIRNGREHDFLDRMVMAGVVEARGHERFGLVAAALEPGPLKVFYEDITESEARHATQFLELLAHYFEPDEIADRLDAFLDADAQICGRLPIRAALH
jgi:tRNA-(ms[2]io[6]A)-hydroxylase